MNLAEARPFTFDISFDEEENQRKLERAQREEEERLAAEEEARHNAEPPAPTFSAEELQAAKAQAWQEGRDAGYTDALAEREAAISAQLESLTAQISGMFVHQDVANEHIALEATETALSLLKRLLPVYAEKHGVDEIKATLAACMEQLSAQSRVTISVSEAQEEIVKPHIEAIAARSGYDGRLAFVPDPDLGPSEVIARWDGGGLDRLDQSVWESVEIILERARNNLPSVDPAADASAVSPPVPPTDTLGPDETTEEIAKQEAKRAEADRVREAARMAYAEPDSTLGEAAPSPQAVAADSAEGGPQHASEMAEPVMGEPVMGEPVMGEETITDTELTNHPQD